jgi:hypothetical protein
VRRTADLARSRPRVSSRGSAPATMAAWTAARSVAGRRR